MVYICESYAHIFHGFWGREGAQGQIRARTDFESLIPEASFSDPDSSIGIVVSVIVHGLIWF
jgi:hypothetical protein